MSTPYFSTPERLAALRTAADAWLDTPYVQSGAVCRNGASCHRLAGAVLLDAGYPLPTVPERGRMLRTAFAGAMQAWFAAHPEHFAPVHAGEAPAPGDLLVANLGIGHIGLCVGGPGPQILQVLLSMPAHYVSWADPAVRATVISIYRPLEVAV